MKKYTDEQITNMVEEGDSNAFEGHCHRLKYLVSIEGEWVIKAPALALEYYEAKLCWYNGAHVATIIMAQLAFEELIRSHYRQAAINMKLKSGKLVDVAGFSELIDEALSDEYITEDEGKKLHEIRKVSNPYVHVKDIKMKGNKQDLDSPSFFTQDLKIHAPELIGIGIIDEARGVLLIMINLFQSIGNRTMGL